MALPEFKKMTQDKTVIPDWSKYMKPEEFISYSVTYKGKIYYDLFEQFVFPCEETGDIKYYIYDPVKHGMPSDRKYPAVMFFHGASNALMGIDCIMCCGAEQFVSPEYQERMGGAYIIVPVANEKRSEEGNIIGAWSDFSIPYHIPVKGIWDIIEEKYPNAGSRIILGASSGGAFTWRLLEKYPDYFDGAMPVASSYMPDDEALSKIGESRTRILAAHGRHDEMADFERAVAPYIDKLRSMKNTELFLPQWVYNGDGGIASVFYGFEMGQHCMINWIQSDLRFDDGTVAEGMVYDGVTGWIKSIGK